MDHASPWLDDKDNTLAKGDVDCRILPVETSPRFFPEQCRLLLREEGVENFESPGLPIHEVEKMNLIESRQINPGGER
jgi:hypothetical protein